MRLLTKTTLYFLILLVPLLAATGYYFFYQFSQEINNRNDRELISDEVHWIQYLQSEADNRTTFILRTPDLLIAPANLPVTDYPAITDTYDFDRKEHNRILYRQLSHTVPINGTTYQIVIRKSQEQKTALLKSVTRIVLLVFAALFAVTLIFNWLISQRLWKPFKQSLEKIRHAELQKMEAIHFEKTKTEEFNQLNASLNAMTAKIYSDYVNMKEFTENAAHEMQTPLAVAQSKMELLLQDTNLNDEQVDSIIQATTALSRLSKFNQSLLLLARIENNQYETNETVDLTDITKKYLQLFEEIIKDKQVTAETFFEEPFRVNLHPLLAESLVSNLLGNSIKYNYAGGKITIAVNQKNYRISNTSQLPAIEQENLFKRFKKSSNSSENANGLGLAIVKKIVDTNNLRIDYNEQNGVHEFVVSVK